MYNVEDTQDFVKEDDRGYASNVLLKMCGEYAQMKEFPEKDYFYGYTRKKKKGRKLGRASEASEA